MPSIHHPTGFPHNTKILVSEKIEEYFCNNNVTRHNFCTPEDRLVWIFAFQEKTLLNVYGDGRVRAFFLLTITTLRILQLKAPRNVVGLFSQQNSTERLVEFESFFLFELMDTLSKFMGGVSYILGIFLSKWMGHFLWTVLRKRGLKENSLKTFQYNTPMTWNDLWDLIFNVKLFPNGFYWISSLFFASDDTMGLFHDFCNSIETFSI